jgi:CRP-like cAMP-binding protein
MTDPECVFFPHRGTVISLVRTTDDGAQIEVGITGAEGFVSVETLLDRRASESTAIVQSGGAVSCVSAQRLRAEFSTDPNTRAVLLGYLSLYLEHLTQNVICHRMHSIEQRLSKWLLILLDRASGHAIHASHDLLSKMLGIQRSGVTLAIGNLTAGDIIEHGRESIRIKDADALTGRACECFTVMQEKLARYRTQREHRRPRARS